VAAWRAAGKSSTETNSSSSGKLQPVESTGTGTGTATSTLVSTASVADRISKAMEEEHRRMVQRIQEEQEAARRRLEEVAQPAECCEADNYMIFTHLWYMYIIGISRSGGAEAEKRR
jgi:hypothetical protein